MCCEIYMHGKIDIVVVSIMLLICFICFIIVGRFSNNTFYHFTILKLFGTVYRHPSKNDKISTDTIRDILHKIKKGNKQIVITGDFNHHLLHYERNEYINYFLNTMLENNF